MHLSNELSCEAGSFSLCHNPHRFLEPEILKLYFPTLEPWVAWSVSLPSFSSWFICTQMCNLQPPPRPPGPPAAALLCILSASPTSLNKCFFFNSLVVRLPYSSIFWQVWLFFVFKFVVLLLVAQIGKIYLPTPPSCPEVQYLHFLRILFTIET